MWDTAQSNDTHLSHDMPCVRCGHGVHTFLACRIDCACVYAMPGANVTGDDRRASPHREE